MPKVPYPYEVNGKLVTGNGSIIPICSLLPSLARIIAEFCVDNCTNLKWQQLCLPVNHTWESLWWWRILIFSMAMGGAYYSFELISIETRPNLKDIINYSWAVWFNIHCKNLLFSHQKLLSGSKMSDQWIISWIMCSN